MKPLLSSRVAVMAGDVNLFWNDHDDAHAAEIEVMVAETRSRRKGLACEALRLLMAYAATQLVTPFLSLALVAFIRVSVGAVTTF